MMEIINLIFLLLGVPFLIMPAALGYWYMCHNVCVRISGKYFIIPSILYFLLVITS